MCATERLSILDGAWCTIAIAAETFTVQAEILNMPCIIEQQRAAYQQGMVPAPARSQKPAHCQHLNAQMGMWQAQG